MADPLRYEIVTEDGTTLDISRQVTLAKVKYGVEIEKDFVPYSKSQGEVNINDWRGEHGDGGTWRLLNIYAMTELIFACSIVSVGVYGSYGRLRIFIELLATAQLSRAVVRRTTGVTDETLDDFLSASGLNISPPADVSLPAMHVAAGTGYENEVEVSRMGAMYTVIHLFDDGGAQYLEDLLTFASMFGFEHPTADRFIVYPLQGLDTDARRPRANAVVASRRALVAERNLSIKTRKWDYGFQELNKASAVIIARTGSGQKGGTDFFDAGNRWDSRIFYPADFPGVDPETFIEWGVIGIQCTWCRQREYQISRQSRLTSAGNSRPLRTS